MCFSSWLLALFWEAIASLEVTEGDLRVLDTARPVFQNSSSLKRRYPGEIRNAAISISKQCQKLSDIDIDLFNFLLQFDDIDQGEATLIAGIWQETAFWLVTGDKRAIANEPKCEEIRQKLKGRVICLEQLILKLLKIHEFVFIRDRVISAIEYDVTLKSCFGSDIKATRENVILSLEGYITDVRRNSGDLLAGL